MRRGLHPGFILLALTPAALFAQWPNYPTPGVPKTADGKPNLNAPAPRTPDGKPDLSGIWENFRAVAGPPTTGFGPPLGSSPFFNSGDGMKAGLPY